MKVRVEVVPWLTNAFGVEQGRFVFEEEVGRKADIRDLIYSLVARHRDFERVAFDPETKKFADQICVILNDRLLESPREWNTGLKEGDII
ncbi:MAG: hypothetical protein ACE5H6_00200, partial [Dehalococcoidia bacterium]